MIALDTNVLVRYLVRDDVQQAESARALLESLTAERPCVCLPRGCRRAGLGVGTGLRFSP